MHLISTILSSTTFHFIGYCVHTAAYLFVSAKKAQFPAVVAHLREEKKIGVFWNESDLLHGLS